MMLLKTQSNVEKEVCIAPYHTAVHMILPYPQVLCYNYDISSDGESDNREEIAFMGRELIPEMSV